MTDRELIQYAAIAAGMPTKTIDGKVFYCNASGEAWSPLSDDGDALRLAVKLQLTVCNEHVSVGVAYCTRGEQVFPEVRPGTECDGPAADHVIPEDYDATRRAIVRAAAEIGRTMVAKA